MEQARKRREEKRQKEHLHAVLKQKKALHKKIAKMMAKTRRNGLKAPRFIFLGGPKGRPGRVVIARPTSMQRELRIIETQPYTSFQQQTIRQTRKHIFLLLAFLFFLLVATFVFILLKI